MGTFHVKQHYNLDSVHSQIESCHPIRSNFDHKYRNKCHNFTNNWIIHPSLLQSLNLLKTGLVLWFLKKEGQNFSETFSLTTLATLALQTIWNVFYSFFIRTLSRDRKIKEEKTILHLRQNEIKCPKGYWA